MVPGTTVVRPLAWSSAMSKVMEEVEENEAQIETIEGTIETVKNAEDFIDKGKEMVKDLEARLN